MGKWTVTTECGRMIAQGRKNARDWCEDELTVSRNETWVESLKNGLKLGDKLWTRRTIKSWT